MGPLDPSTRLHPSVGPWLRIGTDFTCWGGRPLGEIARVASGLPRFTVAAALLEANQPVPCRP
ncbi:hypothetical protein FRAHR75_1290011 [Frankia sp. Hr75.2]|nr:hypothetical protein FRAHR75_1290011 [Frankia sp. Hr75.2]